jgi:hypothetical protein
MLAFGTMAVAAGVITVLKLLTVGTTINLSTQALGAAVLNRPHRLTMRGQEFVSIFSSVVSTILSKEVSQF